MVAWTAPSSLSGAAPQRSVSTSRQFVVYGTDADLRAALCDAAERTKRAALHVLGERDDWRTPIVVNLQLPQADRPEQPRAELNVSQTGFGLKLQLNLTLAADVAAPAVERELLRAVFLEIMYRAAPDVPAGTPYVEPPDWLLDGTLAVSGGDRPGLASALGSAVASGKVMPIEQVLRQRAALLDSPSRELFRAYAGALIAVLTETTEGKQRLARFVSDLPQASNDPVADLRARFSSLGDGSEQAQKNWSAAVARFAAREAYRLLTCEESEQELARVLHLELSDRKQPTSSYALEEFSKFIHLRSAPASLNALRQTLLVLSGRANPLYRPLIAEYENIVGRLARKKTGKVTERLAELRATREHIMRRMSAVADYLNWFEATQARSASGAFQEYMRAVEASGGREQRRRDPISVYLDAIESQFH